MWGEKQFAPWRDACARETRRLLGRSEKRVGTSCWIHCGAPARVSESLLPAGFTSGARDFPQICIMKPSPPPSNESCLPAGIHSTAQCMVCISISCGICHNFHSFSRSTLSAVCKWWCATKTTPSNRGRCCPTTMSKVSFNFSIVQDRFLEFF